MGVNTGAWVRPWLMVAALGACTHAPYQPRRPSSVPTIVKPRCQANPTTGDIHVRVDDVAPETAPASGGGFSFQLYGEFRFHNRRCRALPVAGARIAVTKGNARIWSTTTGARGGVKIPLSRLRPLPTPPETLSITLEHRTGRIVLPLDLTGARSWLAAKAAAQVRAQALADARREAERRAAAEKAREEAEAKQRVLDYLREKRWYDWSGACVDIRVMHEIVCHGMPSDYETENCKVNQRQMIKRGTLFQLPNVHRKISYDARRQQFTFEIPAFLNGELGLSEECAYETCTVTGVSAKGSGFSGGNAPFSVWQRRFNKALERLASRAAAFKVDAEDLPDPRSFEKTVQVDALVRVVKQETASVGDWFGLSLVVVKVVGLRAHVEGTAWLHVVRPGPQQIRERQRCAL